MDILATCYVDKVKTDTGLFLAMLGALLWFGLQWWS
jgi:hypothetical protein